MPQSTLTSASVAGARPFPATIAVVGGGFYGCMLAQHLRSEGARVVLFEKDADLMQRASHTNQARVHGGYHYPRSLMTGLRSRANFSRFVDEFRDCIDDRFEKYYAIARRYSKITARHFRNFCTRIGAPLAPAPRQIHRLFDSRLIEDVFAVEEYAFDAVRLKNVVREGMARRGVDVRLQTEVLRASPAPGGGLTIECVGPTGPSRFTVSRLFNCTYSRINSLLTNSGISPIPLTHEITELALVEMPESLRNCGVTVMCGPFFSFMPFPSRGLHSFSHVRYTPHARWEETASSCHDGSMALQSHAKRSRFPEMLQDAVRYMPELTGCRHVESLWEVKTILPASETDDSRPILLRDDVGMPGLTCVVAAKIDNVFDMLDAVSSESPSLRKVA